MELEKTETYVLLSHQLLNLSDFARTLQNIKTPRSIGLGPFNFCIIDCPFSYIL
jgi:hypothetical protein